MRNLAGNPRSVLPAFREVIELYVAYRIFQGFCLAAAIVALLTVPVWLLVDIAVGVICLGVALIPVAIVWAFWTLLRGLRNSRY